MVAGLEVLGQLLDFRQSQGAVQEPLESAGIGA
jgi:hypothetical protein